MVIQVIKEETSSCGQGWPEREKVGACEGLSEEVTCEPRTHEKEPDVGRVAGRSNSHCKGSEPGQFGISETGKNTAKEHCLRGQRS